MERFWFVLVIIIAYFLGNISPLFSSAEPRELTLRKRAAATGDDQCAAGAREKSGCHHPDYRYQQRVCCCSDRLLAFGSQAAMFCALAAFIGHIWPLLFKFKGGKGVAVAFGTVLGINWQLALLALGIVALTVLITRMVSMGSVIAAVSFPVISYFLERDFSGSVLSWL